VAAERSQRRVIVDGWYGWLIPGLPRLDDRLTRLPAPVARAAARVGPLRGVLLFVASVRRDAVAMIRAERGWRSLLLLRALLGRRRKLVALHFLMHPRRRSGLGRLVDRAWDPVDRWAVRRALLVGQCLTAGERGAALERYGLDAERLVHLPFSWRRSATGEPSPLPAGGPVVVAGRAGCDWATLFAAAAGASWPLTVICSAADRPAVDRLNAGGRATVLSEAPAEAVQGLLRGASACAIALEERPLSQGQIRLMEAVEAGAPVVASDVAGLEGYVADGETALLVAPGDAAALRDALDRLLGDRELAERLRQAAWRRAGRWTAADYLSAVEELVFGGRPRGPSLG
jgi:hypothetical protein